MKPVLLPILLVVLVQNAICGSKHDPQPENATVAVLRAFTNHDVVMVGEIHSNKEEYNWYVSLIRTPEFADRVDDIVLEMGNSLYQQFVGSYVAGDNVRFDQVQRAWRNTVGLIGPQSPLVESLYTAVRDANLQRRGKHQMRIVCGDPAIDPDVSRPICEFVDAGNNHVSQIALRHAGARNVDSRVGIARSRRGKDGTDSRTVGQVRPFARSANNLYPTTRRAGWYSLLGNLLSARRSHGEHDVDGDPF